MTSATGALVPFGWGVFNTMMMLIDAGMGGNAVELGLAGGGAALIELFAAFVLFSERSSLIEDRTYVLPARAEVGIFAAFTAVLIGLSAIFGAWYAPLAGVNLVLTIRALVRERQAERAAS